MPGVRLFQQMPTQIHQDAVVLLQALAGEPRDSNVSGAELSTKTGLDPDRINDAISLLIDSGLAEWLQVMGTAPYDFGERRLPLEMGVALTWGIRVLPIKASGRPSPPSDISGQTWVEYEASASRFLDGDHQAKIARMVQRALKKKGKGTAEPRSLDC